MPGNTADNTTLAEFLEKIERQYGRSDRIWIMDRGIPTEESARRHSLRPLIRYLVRVVGRQVRSGRRWRLDFARTNFRLE